MKLVFICSPFQGKKENLEKAKEYCRFALEQGVIPIAPHVYFSQFMVDGNPEERRKALEMNKKLMEFCDYRFHLKLKQAILAENGIKLGICSPPEGGNSCIH